MDYEGATRRDIKAEKKLMDIYRRQLEELPAGRLTSKRISGKTYYYKVRPGGKRQEYISVDNAQLVAALKDRRYAEEAMKILQENVKAQEAMLKKYRRYSPSWGKHISRKPIKRCRLPESRQTATDGKA